MSLRRSRGGLLEAQVRDNTDRLFPSAPVDIDCGEATNTCWVVSQGSDFVVKMGFGRRANHRRARPSPSAVRPATSVWKISAP